MKILKKSRNEKGGSMVEFAVIAPLLFFILFGVIEFGFVLYNKAVITNASREGARFGIVSRETRYTPAEIISEVEYYCAQWLVTFGNQQDALNVPDPVYEDLDGSGGESFGDNLRVRVDYDYTFFFLPNLPWVGLADTVNLSATAVMKYE